MPELVGDRRSCIVTDEHLANTTVGRAASTALPGSEVVVVPAGEPEVSAVEHLARHIRPDTIVVAVGGGSVLDTAKLGAALAATGGPLTPHLYGTSALTSGWVVAVPTTAGAGAEVTRTAIVSHAGRKGWVWDEALRPAAVVLDPDLTLTLPPAVTVATGLDAMVHAVEAATARHRDDGAEALALDALEVIGRCLGAVLAAPSERSARFEMLVASTAAGLAIDRVGTGVAHALGHALGSLAPLPHGLAVALVLAAVSEYNEASGDERCRRTGAALAGRSYVEAIDALAATCRLDEHVAPVAADHPLSAASVAALVGDEVNAPMCHNNVRPPAPGEVGRLARLVVDRWERAGGR